MNFNVHDSDDDLNDPVFSHLAIIDDSNPWASFTATLQDASVADLLTADIPAPRYAGKFYGIMVDSGCAHGSSAGQSQYLEYCKATGRIPSMDQTQWRHFQFGRELEMSKGMAIIDFPPGDICLSFDVHIASADVQILLGLPHMDRLGICFKKLDDLVVHPESSKSSWTFRLFGDAIVQRNPHILCTLRMSNFVLYIVILDTPSAEKLFILLDRAEADSINADTVRALAKIERQCSAVRLMHSNHVVSSLSSMKTKFSIILSMRASFTSMESRYYTS